MMLLTRKKLFSLPKIMRSHKLMKNNKFHKSRKKLIFAKSAAQKLEPKVANFVESVGLNWNEQTKLL